MSHGIESLDTSTHRSSRFLRAAVLLGIIAAIIAVALNPDTLEFVRSMLDWVGNQGLLGIVVFVALYVLATVVAMPASLLTLGAGAVYGPWLGFAVVSLASTLGATAAFLVARYIARAWITQRVAANPRFRALDEGVAAEGGKLVLLTRLSPVFPFNLQNFGYGLTRIPVMHYVFASWIGMMPGTMMYVYLGYAAGSVAAGGERSPAQWALLGLGLVATIAVAIVAARIALRALRNVPQA